MKQKIFIGFLTLISLYLAANWYVSKKLIGNDVEGLYRIDSCVRDEEFGINYKIVGAIKGRTEVKIIKSDKYPDQENYKVGRLEHIPSDENPRKLYAIKCP